MTNLEAMSIEDAEMMATINAFNTVRETKNFRSTFSVEDVKIGRAHV